MKPAVFEYVRASSLADAIGALATREEAKFLAGGQSLVPLMNFRLARPKVLIDINQLRELDHVTALDGEVALGPLCRHRRLELDPEVRYLAPLLAEAASLVAHPQVRNRGTLGGNLAHADPASELAAALVALGGQVRVQGVKGSRVIPAGELFDDVFTTTLRADELITEVRAPRPRTGEGSAFVEFSPRYGDFAVVGIAVVVRRGDSGECVGARAAAAGVGAKPIDLSEAVTALTGVSALSDQVLGHVAAAVAGMVEPRADVR